MRRLVTAIVAISAVAVGAAASGAVPAGAALASGGLGKAVDVPGLAGLSTGGNSNVVGISCVSAGNCEAAGDYTDGHHNQRGFVAAERNGRWGKATGLPGAKALNADGEVLVSRIACGSAGNCVVGGAYAYDGTGFRFSSFILTERAGRWSKAVSLEKDGDVYSISCASADKCVAGGAATANIGEYYLVGDAFVKQQGGRHWGPLRFIPGLRELEGFGDQETSGSWTSSVTCPSASTCVAGGTYVDKDGKAHGFVADKRRFWGAAIEVPGLAALNTDGNAEVTSVACAQAGSCVAGGYYTSSGSHAFVAVESNGVWGTATEVPRLAALNVGDNAQISSMSCDQAGGCAAVGTYRDSNNHRQVFVANESNGVWGRAIRVPGLPALNAGGNATPETISCGAAAGDCAVGGSFIDHFGRIQGFVVLERGGTWGKATLLLGLAALNSGGRADVLSVSCPPNGDCSAGGHYAGPLYDQRGFVTQTQ